MPEQHDTRSISALLGDAVEQLGKLVNNELQLARAEFSQKLAQAGRGAAFLAGAALLLIPVLVILLISLALWLHQMGASPVASHLIVAAGGGLISIVLALVGLNYLKPEKLTPTVTLTEVGRDVAAVKELAK